MLNEKKVFINCPFDDAYFPKLKALLFCLLYLDFEPQICETSDSGDVRLDKLTKLIKQSRYSIHDLSRIDLNKVGDLPRYNMPFECGFDFASKRFGGKRFENKTIMILDKERYRYQKVLSDISGNDIYAHGNKPEKLIKSIRDWLSRNTNNALVPYTVIWDLYNIFKVDYDSTLKGQRLRPDKIDSLPFKDVIHITKSWIAARPA